MRKTGRAGAAVAALAIVVGAVIAIGTARDAAAIDLPQLLRDAAKKKPPVKGAPVNPRKGLPGRPGGPAGLVGRPGAVPPGVNRNALRPGAPNAAPGNAAAPVGPNGAPLRGNPATATLPNGARPNAANPAAPNSARANAANPAAPNTPGARTSAANPTTPGAANNPNARVNAANPAQPNGARGNAGNPNAAASRPGTSAALNNPGARGNGLNPAGGNRVANVQRVRGTAVTGATVRERQTFRLQHRAQILAARDRLPRRLLPGDRNFTGVPPPGETRFVATELVFQVGANVPRQNVDDLARRFGLTAIAAQSSALTGGTLYHFRVAAGRPVADVIRAIEAERVGVAQPNYVYRLNRDEDAAAPSAETVIPEQYVATKLRLDEAHKMATGKNVLVAIIDSAIDTKHPDLANAIVQSFNAAGKADKPHPHGTGMVGAVAAHGRLTGVAPDARVLAVDAFSMAGQQSAQATTQNIIAGLEWALAKGARVINMSFAGPYDPMLSLALKKAHEKGAVLIAAMGNKGPKSPPLYPAADPNVIAVTATDENDALYTGANRGPHVAVATPGVDVLADAPNAAYQMTTGTSVAAAHASGVAALLIERHPKVDAQTILEVMTVTAMKLGDKTPDDQFGFGLLDPVSALEELDARIADSKVADAGKPAPAQSH